MPFKSNYIHVKKNLGTEISFKNLFISFHFISR